MGRLPPRGESRRTVEDHQRPVGADATDAVTARRKPLFVAKRRFGPSAGDSWGRYVAWSGLTQLHEVVSLDTILCPTVPQDLVAADWEHNVHADYQISYFRSLEYLRARVADEPELNILAILEQPSAEEVERSAPLGFGFLGFDVLDVQGDVSALTNCGGFDDVFAREELSPLGLLTHLRRANDVRHGLRAAYPNEPHAECHVWAIWRDDPSIERPTG
jgi:hypothetical protein